MSQKRVGGHLAVICRGKGCRPLGRQLFISQLYTKINLASIPSSWRPTGRYTVLPGQRNVICLFHLVSHLVSHLIYFILLDPFPEPPGMLPGESQPDRLASCASCRRLAWPTTCASG